MPLSVNPYPLALVPQRHLDETGRLLARTMQGSDHTRSRHGADQRAVLAWAADVAEVKCLATITRVAMAHQGGREPRHAGRCQHHVAHANGAHHIGEHHTIHHTLCPTN